MEVLLFIFGFIVVIYFVTGLMPSAKHNYTCNELRQPHAWEWKRDARGFEKLVCKKCEMIFGDDGPSHDDR